MPEPVRPMRPSTVVLLAFLAIAAFAGNSLFARAAIGGGLIEAGAYTLIRLASGALVLLPFLSRRPCRADWKGALALHVYAGAFSFAYIALPAGTGALILFACVQATIMGVGIARGERPGLAGWAGLALAMLGVAYLLLPGAAGAADPLAALLMACAGGAWGIYTLLGRGAGEPARRTAANFLLAAPLALPLLLLDSGTSLTVHGVILALAAGAITSGLGYVAWYAVAPRLGLATVATVQLATPVAAALVAAIALAEPLTLRLAVAAAMIVGGIVLTLRRRA